MNRMSAPIATIARSNPTIRITTGENDAICAFVLEAKSVVKFEGNSIIGLGLRG